MVNIQEEVNIHHHLHPIGLRLVSHYMAVLATSDDLPFSARLAILLPFESHLEVHSSSLMHSNLVPG